MTWYLQEGTVHPGEGLSFLLLLFWVSEDETCQRLLHTVNQDARHRGLTQESSPDFRGTELTRMVFQQRLGS